MFPKANRALAGTRDAASNSTGRRPTAKSRRRLRALKHVRRDDDLKQHAQRLLQQGHLQGRLKFDPFLWCYVRSIQYNHHTGVGTIFMPPANCVDMSGAINLFRAIDPHAKTIITYEGDNRDTVYLKLNDGWIPVLNGVQLDEVGS